MSIGDGICWLGFWMMIAAVFITPYKITAIPLAIMAIAVALQAIVMSRGGASDAQTG